VVVEAKKEPPPSSVPSNVMVQSCRGFEASEPSINPLPLESTNLIPEIVLSRAEDVAGMGRFALPQLKSCVPVGSLIQSSDLTFVFAPGLAGPDPLNFPVQLS